MLATPQLSAQGERGHTPGRGPDARPGMSYSLGDGPTGENSNHRHYGYYYD